jgi:hypothetical protein
LKLKRKQLIAKLRPSGIRIDVESARNLDLGNGDSIPWAEVLAIFDQTGNELWSSRGVDPLQKETPPISNTAGDDAVQKIVFITQTMNACLQEIRELLGVSLYVEGADVGDRTSGKLAESQSESSGNVIGFIVNAQNQLWEETLYKCAIIEWQKDARDFKPVPGMKDPINSKFDVSIRMKMKEEEKEKIESLIVNGMNAGLLTPKDAVYIREIKNPKMAQLYLSNTEDKNKQAAQQQQTANIQQTAQAQQQSAAQSAQADLQLQREKKQMEAAQKDQDNRRAMELSLLNGVLNIINTCVGDGRDVPDQYKPLVAAVIGNVAMPVIQESKAMEQQDLQNQAHQMASQMTEQQLAQEAMQQQGGQQPGMQNPGIQGPQQQPSPQPQMQPNQ